jgi:hypothetical protein
MYQQEIQQVCDYVSSFKKYYLSYFWGFRFDIIWLLRRTVYSRNLPDNIACRLCDYQAQSLGREKYIDY